MPLTNIDLVTEEDNQYFKQKLHDMFEIYLLIELMWMSVHLQICHLLMLISKRSGKPKIPTPQGRENLQKDQQIFDNDDRRLLNRG